jgi:hypoxia up-regulated 1
MRVLLLAFFVYGIFAAIIGIDFGQQYSKAILLASNLNFEIVLTDTGKRKDLNAVSIRPIDHGGIERVYGSQTAGLCSRFPQSCVLDYKPLLGKPLTQAGGYLKSHFGIQLLPDRLRNSIKFDLGLSNKSYEFTVEEISAMNLQQIRNRGLQTLESHGTIPLLDDVAITVSPFASFETRQAYLDTLKLANFSNVLGLVDEGTAVALNFVSNKKLSKGDYNDEKEYYLVYDMGAGSTTATLFSFTPFANGSSNLEIEAIGFDEELGGKTLTTSVYDLIVDKFTKKFKIKPSKLTPKISTKLYESAEKAKIILSANSEYKVSLESIYNDEDFKTTITREEFEKVNEKIIDAVTKPILTAIEQVDNISISDIQSVILNGGSTRVPFVQNELKQLIGDDKISKSVNTDESCALGTTLRALQLKTTFTSSGHINVIERSSSSYAINIDDGETQVIFPRGSIVGETTKLSLGEITEDETKPINVDLLENGRIYKTYSVDELDKKSEKLSCKSKQTKQIFGSFKLDHNKMFDIANLEVECVDKEPTEEVVEEEAEKNSTVVKPKKSVKPVKIYNAKASHALMKPIVGDTYEELLGKLVYLNTKDDERLELDNLKNKLEALCYELRGYIDDHESAILEIASQEEIDQLLAEVRDTIEWLEFGSEESTYSEVKEKLDGLTSKKDDVTINEELRGQDLSFSGMQKFFKDTTEIVSKIDQRLEEIFTEIEDFRPQFEQEDFNFEKEHDRIKTHLKTQSNGVDILGKVETGLASFKLQVNELGALLDEGEENFKLVAKKTLYKHFKTISSAIIDMLADLITMETGQKERLQLFDSKLKQLVKRKQQKETRRKSKQKKSETTKDAEEPVPEPSAEPVSEPVSEPVIEEPQPEATPETEEIDHDEL